MGTAALTHADEMLGNSGEGGWTASIRGWRGGPVKRWYLSRAVEGGRGGHSRLPGGVLWLPGYVSLLDTGMFSAKCCTQS